MFQHKHLEARRSMAHMRKNYPLYISLEITKSHWNFSIVSEEIKNSCVQQHIGVYTPV